jgi:hypothetical protein
MSFLIFPMSVTNIVRLPRRSSSYTQIMGKSIELIVAENTIIAVNRIVAGRK